MPNDRHQSDTSSSNSVKFTSLYAHATPQEARERNGSTIPDRYYRSPQRERLTTGSRNDRNEGERRYEQENDSYRPTYRPRQSPPSSLNDSRRPNSVRSPSEPSSYHQSNRPLASRTNSVLDPSRPPEVGIRILGHAAKASEERKQREENAKKLMAQKDLQKAQTISVQTTDSTEMAPVTAPSEASIDSTCMEKAANEVSSHHGGAVPAADGNPFTHLVAESIKKIIDEVGEVSSLKTRKDKSLAKLDKANAGFEKSRVHHEKFPSIKEGHTNTRKAAEKEYKKANEQLEFKDASLHQLATLVAEQIVPRVLGAGTNTQEQKKTQDRIEALESTCRKYEELLQGQRSYLEDQQNANRVAALEKERKDKAVAEDLRLLHVEVDKSKLRLDKFFGKQNEFVMASKIVTEELARAKGAIESVSTKVAFDLGQQLRNLDTLNQLSSKVNTIDDRSSSTHSELAGLATTVNTLGQSLGTLKTTIESQEPAAQTLNQEQTKIHAAISDVNNRVEAVESKLLNTKDTDELKERITRIETAPSAPAPEQATLTEVVSMAEKIKSLLSQHGDLSNGGISNLKATVDDLGAALSTALGRIDKVEKQAKTLEATQKKAGATQVQHSVADVAAVDSRLVGLQSSHHPGTPGWNENQTAAIKQQQTKPRASNEIEAANNRDLKYLSDQVVELREYINSVDEGLSEIPGLIGETIGETVESKLGLIKSRLGAVETSVNSVQESQQYSAEQIRSQNQVILDAKNSMMSAAAGKAIEIIKFQNIFAPSTLDDKFTASLNGVNTSLMAHIEAQSLATENLQRRMDNLNTSDVHLAMVNSLSQTHPSLSQLSAIDLNIKSLQKQVEEFREAKKAPGQEDAILLSSGEDLGGKVDIISEKLKGIETKVDNMAQKLQYATPEAPSVLGSRDTSARPPSVYQLSTSSDNSNRNASKRKHPHVNGSGPCTPKKSNGTKPSGAPNRKRARRTNTRGDNEDINYQDGGNSQVGISDDE